MNTPGLIRITAFLIASCTAQTNFAQAFTSGSTGSDGALDVLAGDTLILKHASGIYNYTSIHVHANARVKFERNDANTPIYLLATADVLIEGTINVSGDLGDKFSGGLGGPGGFNGGMPGVGAPPGAGHGPGGGKPGPATNVPNGAGGGSYATTATSGGSTNQGAKYGTQLLMPLVGGSGGGGMPNVGGGGGGGAILIASRTRIDVNTTGVAAISADGAQTGYYGYGSGGAIRLVAPAIAGSGRLSVSGNSWAGDGRIRIDTVDRSGMNLQFTPPNVPETVVVGGLMAVFPPVSPQLDVVSVGGQPIAPGTKTPILIKLPFGSQPTQVIELQARDFNQSLLVTLALIPDSGSPSLYNFTIDNISANPSAKWPVNVTMPANVVVRVMAWTR